MSNKIDIYFYLHTRVSYLNKYYNIYITSSFFFYITVRPDRTFIKYYKYLEAFYQ